MRYDEKIENTQSYSDARGNFSLEEIGATFFSIGALQPHDVCVWNVLDSNRSYDTTRGTYGKRQQELQESLF